MTSDEGSDPAARVEDPSIVGEDGRVLLFSCERFVRDIVDGDCCFVCGAEPGTKVFNDEHIIPRWVLRRFGLFFKTIKLPNGERRQYDRYKVPCCKDCNSLLGERVETPVSKLLEGDADEVVKRIVEQGPDLVFVWLTLLFLKIHLKDRSVRVHKNPTLGTEVVGEMYDWPSFHHIHAVARSPYTQATLLPGVIGTLRVFPIEDGLLVDEFDYLSFSFEQTIAVRIGNVGIVAVLDDAGASAQAWAHELGEIRWPISTIQLKELAAMFAVANDDLQSRPQFGTAVERREKVSIFARVPQPRHADFDREKFGHALAFALRDLIEKGAIELGGTRDPATVSDIIEAGRGRFLLDGDGRQLRMEAMSTAPSTDTDQQET